MASLLWLHFLVMITPIEKIMKTPISPSSPMAKNKSITPTTALSPIKIETTAPEDKGSYKILCSSMPRVMEWGSYLARCITFKIWADKCAPSVDVVTGPIPAISDKTIHYNATMFVKAVPPVQDNLGKIFIDVVDQFGMNGFQIPTKFEVIVQNPYQGELFPNHKTHIVEHWYNSYPLDMTMAEPMYIPPIEQSSQLNVGTVCFLCPNPNIKDVTDVNFTMINEIREGKIQNYFLKYMAMEGWTEDKMSETLNDPDFGTGMLYFHVFRKFDILIVTPKTSFEKLRYGSIQRVTSAMRSGVPVLVEALGPAFESFIDQYNYTCAFSKNSGKYLSLEEAIVQMKDVLVRKECQRQGLRIAQDFSPNVMGRRLLRDLGYLGDVQC